jgi:hypothetical protein
MKQNYTPLSPQRTSIKPSSNEDKKTSSNRMMFYLDYDDKSNERYDNPQQEPTNHFNRMMS